MTMSNVQPPAPPGPPGLTSPFAPPVPSADDAKRAWRRLSLIALAVALVMIMGAGAGGYLLARSVRKSSDWATCGALHCIPSLKASSVIDALKERGFTCVEKISIDSTACQMRIGDTRFESHVMHKDDLIYHYDDSVNTDKDGEASASTKAFLMWFAALPFSNDPVLTEEIEAWLTSRLSGGADTKATIGGYAYSLKATDQHSLSLNVSVDR